jgi:hypothetical protein
MVKAIVNINESGNRILNIVEAKKKIKVKQLI